MRKERTDHLTQDQGKTGFSKPAVVLCGGILPVNCATTDLFVYDSATDRISPTPCTLDNVPGLGSAFTYLLTPGREQFRVCWEPIHAMHHVT